MKKIILFLSILYINRSVAQQSSKVGLGYLTLNQFTIDSLIEKTGFGLIKTTNDIRYEFTTTLKEEVEKPSSEKYSTLPFSEAVSRSKFIEGYRFVKAGTLKINELTFTDIEMVFFR